MSLVGGARGLHWSYWKRLCDCSHGDRSTSCSKFVVIWPCAISYQFLREWLFNCSKPDVWVSAAHVEESNLDTARRSPIAIPRGALLSGRASACISSVRYVRVDSVWYTRHTRFDCVAVRPEAGVIPPPHRPLSANLPPLGAYSMAQDFAPSSRTCDASTGSAAMIMTSRSSSLSSPVYTK